MYLKNIFIRLAAIAMLVVPFITTAQSLNPGWHEVVEPTHRSIEDALTKIEELKSTVKVAPMGALVMKSGTISDERFNELAASLENNPIRILEHVRNTIEYVPYYGQLKGAGRTLLDQAGNDADQSALLVKLLHKAGYAATFVHGTMNMPAWSLDGVDLSHWLGVSWLDVPYSLDSGGIPFDDLGNYTYDVTRVWVRVWVDGTPYDLDPAFKRYNESFAKNITSLSGYNRSAFLAAAGGTETADYAQGLDGSAISNLLTTLTVNLLNNLKQTYPNASLHEITGGRTIFYEEIGSLTNQLYFPSANTTEYNELPSALFHPYSVSYGSMSQDGYLHEIAESGLSLRFSGTEAVAQSMAMPMGEMSMESELLLSDPEETQQTASIPSFQTLESFSTLVMSNFPPVSTNDGIQAMAAATGTAVALGIVYNRSPYNTIEPVIYRVYRTYSESVSMTSNPQGAFSNRSYSDTENGVHRYNVRIRFDGANKSAGTKTGQAKFVYYFGGWQYTEYFDVSGTVANVPLYDFGHFTTGSSTLTLWNKVSGATGVSLRLDNNSSGAFSIVSDASKVKIRFNAAGQSQGTKTATVVYRFTHNGWPYVWVYDLKAVVAEAPSIQNGSYTWSSPPKYQSETKTGTVRLKNTGTKMLTFTSASLVGADASKFQLVSGYGYGNIYPGSYRDITVRYQATTVGIHDDATIRINFNYDGIPYNNVDFFPLSGQTLENFYAQLWQGDTLIDQQLAPMGQETLTLSISHPYGTNTWMTVDYPIKPGGTYAIITGFGSSNNGKLLAERQKKVRELREEGLESLSPEILSESLHVIGQAWLQETSLHKNLLNNLLGIRQIYHHRMGIAAQEEGYYVDIKAQYSSSVAFGSHSQKTALRTSSLFASAMEHGCLEQLQSSGREAVSTVKLLKIANDMNWKIYRATSNNWGTVSSVLQIGGYTADERAEFAESVNQHEGLLVLPQNRDVPLGDWAGKGYVQCESANGLNSIAMIIGGDYHGGYGAYQWDLDTFYQDSLSSHNYYDYAESWHPTEADPIDMVTGAYTFDHADFSMGGPLPLQLTRSYNSAQHNVEGIMGYGWTHSFNIYARRHSAYEQSLGIRTPEEAAAAIVVTIIAQDLLQNSDTPKGWAAAALATQWAMDEMTDNAVSIYIGTKVLTFIEQPDGSFTSPPGVTSTLTNNSGIYTLQERHGSTYTFNANLKLAQVVDPDSNSLTFAYNTQTNLHTVTSSFDPVLTFGYTGDLLTSVSDNDGRSISYQYDADNNLEHFVDAESESWTVGYDSAHRVKWMKDPEQVTTIQNFYNSIGQVTNQISSSGNDWNFRFSGTRNVSEDPLGNQTAYHLDGKQRTWSVEQPNGARSYSTFDGQNHVIESIAPNSVTNFYLYDVDHNLLVQANAFGLPEEVATAYGYDASHHLVAVTNALGKPEQTVSLMTYTGTHHLDIVTKAAGTPEQTISDTDYFPNGLPQQVSEGNGLRITSYTYDSHGNPDAVTVTDAGTVNFDYNLRGELTQRTDAEGNSISFAYDDRGLPLVTTYPDTSVASKTYWKNRLLKTATDPEGNTSTTIWNAAYKQTGIVFPDGSSVTNLYDSADRLIANQNPEGYWTSNTLDKVGRVLTVFTDLSTASNRYDIVGNRIAFTDAEGNQTQYDYDALNRKIRVDMPDGSFSTFGYNALGQLSATTNQPNTALERVVSSTYDSLGRVVQMTDALENSTTFEYNALGLQTLTVDPLGNETRTGYNALGKPVAVTNALDQVSDMSYDLNGNLETVTDPQGRTTHYIYDEMNRRIRTDYPDSSFVTATFDSNGSMLSQTDAKGATTTFGYNDMNRLVASTSTVDSVSAITSYAYNNNGNVLTQIDAEGNTTSYQYDALGRQVFASSTHSQVTNEFDAVGNLTLTELDPGGLNLWTTNGYDSMNRLVNQQTSLASKQFQHDELGRTVNSINALSKEWKTEYDLQNRPTAKVRPTGAREETQFDVLGRRTRFINAEGKAINFGFDALGRLTSITNAIGKVTSFTFDDAGNLSSRTDAENAETEYGYDPLSRLVAVTNEGVEVATFSHDPNGNIVAHTSPLASATFGYNEQNLRTSTTQTVQGVSAIIQNTFDLNGNRTAIEYPGGLTVNYNYGADNRLESVETDYAANSKTLSFGYDGANRLTAISYPNGINSSFGYDAESRVSNIVHGSFVNRQIIRNALGFKTTEMINAGTKPTVRNTQRSLKTHNDADQLISERVQQGTNWTDVAYSYNDNGGLESVVVPNSDSVSYDYDYNNRLVSTTEDTETTEYLYDASGARVGRIHNGVTTYFVVDYVDGLKRPLAETDASGIVTRYYVWSGAHLLCHIEANGDAYYYHSDELGSTLALTDSSGTVTDEFAYMPYGYATHTPHAGSSSTPFQWLGGYGVYYDADTELHLTLHRAYSCSLKRFISPDPLGIDGGVNVYAMANLNPLYFVDPYGLSGLESVWGDIGNSLHGFGDAFVDGIVGLRDVTIYDTIVGVGDFLKGAWNGDISPYDVFYTPTVNYASDFKAAYDEGDFYTTGSMIGGATFNVELGLVTAKAGQVAGGAFKGAASTLDDFASGMIDDAFDGTSYSRVISKNHYDAWKAGKASIGGEETWITYTDDLAGISSSQGIAERLTLLDDVGNFRMNDYYRIDFSIDDAYGAGLRSPIETVRPRGYGFQHGGFTQGGARELLMNPEAPISIINEFPLSPWRQ